MTASSSLRILVVTDAYPPDCGGSGWSTHALVRGLTAAGHRVEVLEIDPRGTGDGDREFEGVAVRTAAIGGHRTVTRHLRAEDYSYRPVLETVRTVLQKRSFDIVHGQHLHSGPGAAAAARAEGVAAVVTLRDYWPVRLDGIAWPDQVEGQGQEVAWTARALRESFGLPPWLARVAAPRARRRLLRRQAALAACSRIVCVSDAVRRRVAPALEPACEVIPNMIDADEAARRAARFDPPREPGSYLFAAGKLNSMKGFDTLVDELAAAGWKGRVVIAGGGPLQAAIREQAAAAGLAVELLGWTGADELMGWMAQARAVLVPSAWEEPLARVILEAQALAVPVVARATGGSTDAIDHGVTGFLYQGTDDLAGSLTTLSDDAQAASIGAAGAQVCRERYAPDVVVRRVEGVYAEAMQSRKRDG